MKWVCLGLAGVGVAASFAGIASAIGGPAGPILWGVAGYVASYASGVMCIANG